MEETGEEGLTVLTRVVRAGFNDIVLFKHRQEGRKEASQVARQGKSILCIRWRKQLVQEPCDKTTPNTFEGQQRPVV